MYYVCFDMEFGPYSYGFDVLGQLSLKIISKGLFNNYVDKKSRPVVPGCAGCAMAHPDFGRSVNPISTRGSDYTHLITTGTP